MKNIRFLYSFYFQSHEPSSVAREVEEWFINSSPPRFKFKLFFSQKKFKFFSTENLGAYFVPNEK
jgi:hypothetical protein